jgi:Fe-S-cluster-containing hydrogenase component 2
MLKTLLEQKKCFKLICGAGNEDLQEVEKLVALYAKAGCKFFDLCANEEVLKAAQKGLGFSVPKVEQGDYFFCVSVGIKGEPHLNKAKIDKNKCVECGNCAQSCPQSAIWDFDLKSRLGLLTQQHKALKLTQHEKFEIQEEKCIGCLRCLKVCEIGAIEVYQKNKPIEEILGSLFALHPSPFTCLELHASGEDEDDVQQRWDYIQENFGGMLSICIDRSKLGNEAILKRIKNLIKDRKPYTTIIQADGAPMSGGEDDFKTTLQAVAMAEVFQNEKLPVYILLSGGTNSKSLELANLCGLEVNGVSVGSYARKIVKKYIEREDFLQNEEVFNEALKIAQQLVGKVIKPL